MAIQTESQKTVILNNDLQRIVLTKAKIKINFAA